MIIRASRGAGGRKLDPESSRTHYGSGSLGPIAGICAIPRPAGLPRKSIRGLKNRCLTCNATRLTERHHLFFPSSSSSSLLRIDQFNVNSPADVGLIHFYGQHQLPIASLSLCSAQLPFLCRRNFEAQAVLDPRSSSSELLILLLLPISSTPSSPHPNFPKCQQNLGSRGSMPLQKPSKMRASGQVPAESSPLSR